jgi:myo-inositol-1(or 4)-monophosphatase
VDDKLRASDRVRAVSASTKASTDDASVDLYARSTVVDFADESAEGSAAPAPAAAPAPRKLTRVRRDAPPAPRHGDGAPFEGDASSK